jgi:hypothetical protein
VNGEYHYEKHINKRNVRFGAGQGIRKILWRRLEWLSGGLLRGRVGGLKISDPLAMQVGGVAAMRG